MIFIVVAVLSNFVIVFLHVIVQCVTLDECVITKLTTVFLHAPMHDHAFLEPFCVLFAYLRLDVSVSYHEPSICCGHGIWYHR